jgi:hypothetical protein
MRLLLPLLALLAAAPALAQPLAISSPNPEEFGGFGSFVSAVPDANGDGRADFLVGAYNENPDASLEYVGRAYLYSGTDGALLHTLESPSAQDGGYFGHSVAGVADVDGDGHGDLLVGAYNEDLGPLLVKGRVYLFSGATGDLLHTLVSPNPEELSYFATAVAGVHDADGDGRGDLLVGAYDEDTDGDSSPYDEQGRAYLFSGATGALLHTLEAPDAQILGHFGYPVSGVPDTDGDGRGDLLIGTLSDAGRETRRAYLFSGATGALLHELSSPADRGAFSGAVTGLPDVDGDGRGDLGIGAHYERGHGVYRAGRAYVFSGATGNLLSALISPNAEVEGNFGVAGAGLGDVDGDGRGDGVVAALHETVGDVPHAGRVYLYRTGGAERAWAGAEEVAVAREPPSGLPASLMLSVSPNPLASSTAVRLSLPQSSEVIVEVLDVLGRRVALVQEGTLAAGVHALRWTPEPGIAGGVYLLRLYGAGAPAQVQRVTLTR